jgi:hypothetical protein
LGSEELGAHTKVRAGKGSPQSNSTVCREETTSFQGWILLGLDFQSSYCIEVGVKSLFYLVEFSPELFILDRSPKF